MTPRKPEVIVYVLEDTGRGPLPWIWWATFPHSHEGSPESRWIYRSGHKSREGALAFAEAQGMIAPATAGPGKSGIDPA